MLYEFELGYNATKATQKYLLFINQMIQEISHRLQEHQRSDKI